MARVGRFNPINLAVRWALGIRYYSGLLESYLPSWAARRFYPARTLKAQTREDGTVEHEPGRYWVTYNPTPNPLWLFDPTPEVDIDTPVEKWLSSVSMRYPSQYSGKLRHVAQKALALKRAHGFGIGPLRTHGLFCGSGGRYAVIEISTQGVFTYPIEFAREARVDTVSPEQAELEKEHFDFAPKGSIVDPTEVVFSVHNLGEGKKLQLASAIAIQDSVYKDPTDGTLMNGLCAQAGWAFRLDGHEAQLILFGRRPRNLYYTYRFKATFQEGELGLPGSVQFTKLDEGWLCSGYYPISLIRIPGPDDETNIPFTYEMTPYLESALPANSICPVYVFYDGQEPVLFRHHWGRTPGMTRTVENFGGGDYASTFADSRVPCPCGSVGEPALSPTWQANDGYAEEETHSEGVYAYFSCDRTSAEEQVTHNSVYQREDYSIGGNTGEGEAFVCYCPDGQYYTHLSYLEAFLIRTGPRTEAWEYFQCLGIPMREREAAFHCSLLRRRIFPHTVASFRDATGVTGASSAYLSGTPPPGDVVVTMASRGFGEHLGTESLEMSVEEIPFIWLARAGQGEDLPLRWAGSEIDPVLMRDFFDPRGERRPMLNAYIGAYGRDYIAYPWAADPRTNSGYPLDEFLSQKLAFCGDEDPTGPRHPGD